jgi:hypothetical protein
MFDLKSYIGVNSTIMTNLADLQALVSATQYDIMIIGAGSMALPIAAVEKKRGKVIIHMGGNTGLMFGLKGGRFDSRPVYKKVSMSYVLCRMSYVVCSMSYVVCSMSYVVCSMSYVVCSMFYVVCRMTYLALHNAYCIIHTYIHTYCILYTALQCLIVLGGCYSMQYVRTVLIIQVIYRFNYIYLTFFPSPLSIHTYIHTYKQTNIHT